MKIVILDGFLAGFDHPGWPLDGVCDVVWYDETDPADALARVKDADAVFVNRAPLTAELFDACPRLRFAGTFGTGYNMIDLEAAAAHHITVCNVPEYSTMAVAQNTISLLLQIACQTGRFDRLIKSGGWESPTEPTLVNIPMFELAGRTLGIVGCGNIGAAVGRTAAALGMQVLTCRRHPAAGAPFPLVPLEALLERSDVVSLHCPLTAETRGMIGRDALERMKPGAVLLNTARGGLLDEQAVADALDSGKLYMAGLDVFSTEPPTAQNPLAKHPRVICTPHISWMPLETRKRLLQIAGENLLAFWAGKPQNVVHI